MARWINEKTGYWEHDFDERTLKLMGLAIKAAGARDEDDVDGYIGNGQLEVITASDKREYVSYSGIENSDGCEVLVDKESGKVIIDPEETGKLIFSFGEG